MPRSDKLVVKGHGRNDGEYAFDLGALLNIGFPGSLDILEQHKVFTVSGVPPAALGQAASEGQPMLMVALALIILGRHEKIIKVESLSQGHILYDLDGEDYTDRMTHVTKGILWILQAVDDEDDDALPPAVTPSEPSEPPQTSGGESANPSSAPPANDPSPTGPPGSLRSVTSDPETLAS